MAQRARVPQFGNWESEENVHYTAYFDKAGEGKSGGKMNPNDPQENHDMLYNNSPPVQAPPFQMQAKSGAHKGPEAVRSKHERYKIQEKGDLKRVIDSPLRHDTFGLTAAMDLPHRHQVGVRVPQHKAELEAPNEIEARRPKNEYRRDGDLRKPTDLVLRHDTVGRIAGADLPLNRSDGTSSSDTAKRALRQSVGSNHSIEHSHLHPHFQAKIGGKSSGVSSPSWERKGSSEGSGRTFAPLTPGRSRLRSVNRGYENPDHSSAVPKFGDWDETNPTSGAGYTHIFERVREEKQSTVGNAPVPSPTETSYSNAQKPNDNDNPKVHGAPLLRVQFHNRHPAINHRAWFQD